MVCMNPGRHESRQPRHQPLAGEGRHHAELECADRAAARHQCECVALDLIDANGEMIATIPVDGIAAAGVLGANNLVSARTESVLTAALSEELVNILYAGARLRSRVAFTTSDQSQHLRILDSYRMDLQITLAANYMVNGDE